MFGKSLEKAYIEILAGNGAGNRIKVMFNPAEYSLERANAYKSTPLPGLGSPLIQFVNGDAATLSMDLFLDDLTEVAETEPNDDPKAPMRTSGFPLVVSGRTLLYAVSIAGLGITIWPLMAG